MLKAFVIAVGFAIANMIAWASEPLSRDADHDYDAPAPGSYRLPVVKVAPDGVVVESNGTSVNLRDLIRGRVTVLSFIYTRCAAPRACPYATGVLSQLHRISMEDNALAKNLGLISLSFDPEYDTPERLATYAEGVDGENAGCEWHFLTAESRTELDSILNGYGQAVDKRPDAKDPQGPLYHILRVFLIDHDGCIRNIYSSGTLDLRLVLSDVKTLLLEQAKR